MANLSIPLSEEMHQKLMEIQYNRKVKKKQPTALNLIAAELLGEKLKTVKTGEI